MSVSTKQNVNWHNLYMMLMILMRREDKFHSNEEARQPTTFLENEAQRGAETRQRGNTLFRELKERVASIPPIPLIPVPPPRDPEQASIIGSIRTATQSPNGEYHHHYFPRLCNDEH